MPMHESTIRFAATTYARLQDEAAKEGISVAQYVRELVVAHLARLDALRGDVGPSNRPDSRD